MRELARTGADLDAVVYLHGDLTTTTMPAEKATSKRRHSSFMAPKIPSRRNLTMTPSKLTSTARRPTGRHSISAAPAFVYGRRKPSGSKTVQK